MEILEHDTTSAQADRRAVRKVCARIFTAALTVVLVCANPFAADAATRYVADSGFDAANCGIDLATACRSITKAIALAAPLDIVLVGPGRYGDLNRNGALGDIAGEETGSPGCSCVLSINKNVIVISSAGAAVTVIDARSVDVIQNVLLITNGGEFGRPGKGFTVTETAQRSDGQLVGDGIVIDSNAVSVRGNQVTFTRLIDSFGGSLALSGGIGILTVNSAPIRIEGNQVTNWSIGIYGWGAATLSKNQLIRNQIGIWSAGGTVVGNVATSNRVGIFATGATNVRGNAAYINFGAAPDEFSTGSV